MKKVVIRLNILNTCKTIIYVASTSVMKKRNVLNIHGNDAYDLQDSDYLYRMSKIPKAVRKG